MKPPGELTISPEQVENSKPPGGRNEVRQRNPEHGQRIGVISGIGQIKNYVADQRVREIFGRRFP